LKLKRTIKLIAVVAVLGIVAAACGSDDNGGNAPSSAAPAGDLSGGTIKFAQLADFYSALDPQKEYSAVTWEYYRCCLLRTLLSYKGVPTAEGGGDLYPDLAAQDPEQSADGLTWTFQIKPGIHYAPPFDDVEITANDFITALKRTSDPKANIGGYSFYYSVIKGFDDYGAGKAKDIAGAKAIDDHTLQITLTEPTGDLGYRFAMGSTAPIPPNGDAEYGAAEGHDKDYGRFLVASGPYMIQGSDEMDFSKPADDQDPVSGYIPGRSLVMERNPSWSADTDDLRKAYPDTFEVTMGGDNDDLYNKLSAGEIDFVVDGIVPPDQLKKYQTDPDLQDRLHVFPSDAIRYVSFNLAEPPFDDVHVRKAVNWIFDKDGFRQLRGGPTLGELAGHIFVDSLENNILKDYDPYETTNGAGDVAKAQEEMKQSKYDSDGDGVCDDPSCENILSITDREDPYPKQAALLEQFLKPLGMTLDVKELERGTMYTKCYDPNAHTTFCIGPAWGKDFPDGITFGQPLFDSSGINASNYNLLGASPEDLKKWGYSVTEVPSVDDKVAECAALPPGDARYQCWADLDKYLMEEVVPFVNYLFDNNVDVVSANVTNYSFDQFAGLAAYDQLAVGGGSS
jgi:peptide/nickel transport system substrate-binding protein